MEWITGLTGAANIVLRVLARDRPKLVARVRPVGGSHGQIHFLVEISNIGTAPALDCVVHAVLEDLGGVYTSEPFDLPAGVLRHQIFVPLKRPEHGDLIKELNAVTTLYGRSLEVRVHYGRGKAVCRWTEPRYDPVNDGTRYRVQQKVWRDGRGLAV